MTTEQKTGHIEGTILTIRGVSKDCTRKVLDSAPRETLEAQLNFSSNVQ